MSQSPRPKSVMFLKGRTSTDASQPSQREVERTNPLLGMDSDSSDEEETEPLRDRGEPQRPKADHGRTVSADFDSRSESDSNLVAMKKISYSDTDIDTIGQAGGKRVSVRMEDLPMAAASWFSPDAIKPKQPAPASGEQEEEAPKSEEERRLAQNRGELEHVQSIISRLQKQLEELFTEDGFEFEKEARKIREDISTWELKQWKILQRMAEKGSEKENAGEVLEEVHEGKVIKTYSITNGKMTILSATLPVLVSLLVDESNHDIDYVADFLLSFRLYLTPKEVLTMLQESYAKHEGNAALTLRTVMVLKKWIEKSWRTDFDLDGNQEAFFAFFKILAPSLKKMGKDSGELDLETLASFLSHPPPETRKQSSSFTSKNKESLLSRILNTDKSYTFSRATASIEGMALALCSKEREMYAALRPEEFLEKLTYKGEGPNPKTEHLNALIMWVNQINYWMGHEICLNYDVAARAKIVSRFIQIAKECLQLGGFNTLFAIVTSLNSSPLQRLSKTWALVSKKHLVTFQELEAICSPQMNYRVYRDMEQGAKPPFIPFLGLLLKDLVFMNDGNTSRLSNGTYSFSKLRTVCKAISAFLRFQRLTHYETSSKPGMEEYIDHIQSIKGMEERHMYKLSCLCEPPTWKRKSFFVLSKQKQEI